MRLIEQLGLLALRNMNPERAHGVALSALRSGLAARTGIRPSPRLATKIAGIALSNPIGLAAGFDKNATAVDPLLRAGFGFVEVGAATPLPQPGNPRPRLFRLTEDRGVINRFGFNNDGVEAIATRLEQRRAPGVVGLNLGANKTSEDRSGDYAQVLARAGAHVDFATINVSSPNTEALRDLQGAAALDALIARTQEARDALPRRVPLFLKVAPDLEADEIADIAKIARARQVDALITTNTTLARDGLQSPHASEPGGLSGAPLTEKSRAVLTAFARALDGRVPLIAVGGIGSGAEAYARIRLGASAVQLYSALVYDGLSLAGRIAGDLDRLLEADGLTVPQAIGRDL